MNPLALFLTMLIFPIAVFVGVLLARIALRGRQRIPAEQVARSASFCRCGYELTNLDRIRCPECGRVFGFDATPQELGLSDDELRRATEARERRTKQSS